MQESTEQILKISVAKELHLLSAPSVCHQRKNAQRKEASSRMTIGQGCNNKFQLTFLKPCEKYFSDLILLTIWVACVSFNLKVHGG